eukprot:TRINITY_DN12474_c0_g8_i1.p1 TRINITY_DN12474_c0_g8~~TRINITY_DN12474_c0_g8_i1.p1  ORF type:complete len:653 (+),score=120.59 TRINITY_DN12474_c0_g8_i1:114-2072(+)
MSSPAWSWFRETFQSAKVLLAPMTGRSDATWRALCRQYGIMSAFSPMLHAKHLVEQPAYFEQHIEQNNSSLPLMIQICANDEDVFVAAIEKLRGRCKGVDLNLAWTAKRAAAGPYGAHLLDDVPRIVSIVKAGVATGMPITCKLRVHNDIHRTIALAQQLEAVGASMLTIEARTPLQKGKDLGLCDWTQVSAVRVSVNIPIVAVGDVIEDGDVDSCLRVTGAAAVMCGQALLNNPGYADNSHPHVCEVARRYCDILASLSFMPPEARRHLHDLFHLILLDQPLLRQDLNQAATISQLHAVIDSIEAICPVSADADISDQGHSYTDTNTGLRVYPAWRCQASYRRYQSLSAEIERFPDDTLCYRGLNWWQTLAAAGYVPENYAELDAAYREELSESNMRKFDRMVATKLKRRYKEQLKIEKRKSMLASGELEFDRFALAKKLKRQAKGANRAKMIAAMEPNSGALRVAVDMSLQSAMSSKEIGKLASQVRRLYGLNTMAEDPAHIFLTGLEPGGSIERELQRRNSGFDQYRLSKTQESHLDVFEPSELVFLTPDSPNPLLSIDKSKVYVMGGLVDEHIVKDYTLERANSAGIATARLPIPEMTRAEKSYAPVLSINQVFEALLIVQNQKDGWQQALEAALPKRKGFRVVDSDH